MKRKRERRVKERKDEEIGRTKRQKGEKSEEKERERKREREREQSVDKTG